MDMKALKERFIKTFGENSTVHEGGARSFMAPGRVNLIGEYTDFNGGQVLPCALDFGTYAVARKRNDGKILFASVNFEKTLELSVNDIQFQEEDDWCNYPKGVLKYMMEAGYPGGGMEILFHGNIPNGAGLSSSASIEVLTGVILDGLYGDGKMDRVELAKISQKAENQFVGVNCGIMDQFAISVGKKGKTLQLHCDTLDYSYSDFDLKNYTLVIMNTNKRRALNESKYNERREECESALHDLNTHIGEHRAYLCHYTSEEFMKWKEAIKNPMALKRAEHIIYENERVTGAAKYLQNGNLVQFGELLCASHKSLKELLEVSGRELDIIVEEAMSVEGCIGSRMTGAGFGGCAIALVETDKVSEFQSHVAEGYRSRTGLVPDFYTTTAGDGAGELI